MDECFPLICVMLSLVCRAKKISVLLLSAVRALTCTARGSLSGGWITCVVFTTRLLISCRFMTHILSGVRWLFCITAWRFYLRRLRIRLSIMVSTAVILSTYPMVLLLRLTIRVRSAFLVLSCVCCVGLLFINICLKRLILNRLILLRRRGASVARCWLLRLNSLMRLVLLRSALCRITDPKLNVRVPRLVILRRRVRLVTRPLNRLVWRPNGVKGARISRVNLLRLSLVSYVV